MYAETDKEAFKGISPVTLSTAYSHTITHTHTRERERLSKTEALKRGSERESE